MIKKGIRVTQAALFVAILLVVSACAGTSTSTNSGNTPPAATPPAQGNNANTEEEMKDLELRWYGTLFSNIVYLDGEDENNNLWEKMIKEHTGIQIYTDAMVPQNEYTNKINLAIAANNAPDVITGDITYISQLVRSGALQPLDDYIEQFANDELKAWLNYYEDGLLPLTFDGKLYALPNYSELYQDSMILFLRKDWLDNVALDVPVTIDELETVLRAFVNNDPDQNGRNDTLGMVLTNTVGTAWAASVDPIFGAFGGTQGYWVERDGQIVYGSIQPEMKEGLSLLQRWYQEGLIDQEFAVNDEAKALEKVSANLSGAYFSPAWDTTWNIANSMNNDPNAEWIVVDIPAGPDGTQQRRGNPITKGGYGLYTNSTNGEAFIKYYNALVSHPEISKAQDLGFEGYNYVLNEEGVPVEPENAIKLRYSYPPYKHPEYKLGYLIKDESEWSLSDKKFNATVTPLNREADQLILDTSHHEVMNKFTGAPTPTMQSKWAVLKKQEDETFVKIIMGEPLSNFDAFVETWNALGGTQVTDEVNAWYQANK